MRLTLHRSLWLCAIVAIIGLTGCGTPIYPVRGKVTFEGKPLQGGGSISFVPLDKGKAASGEIAEDGSYTLTTERSGDGAMVGDFRVVIQQVTQKERETEDGKKGPTGPIIVVKEADQIPAVYADHHQSPLTAKVEAKSPNEIDFPLKRK